MSALIGRSYDQHNRPATVRAGLLCSC